MKNSSFCHLYYDFFSPLGIQADVWNDIFHQVFHQSDLTKRSVSFFFIKSHMEQTKMNIALERKPLENMV